MSFVTVVLRYTDVIKVIQRYFSERFKTWGLMLNFPELFEAPENQFNADISSQYGIHITINIEYFLSYYFIIV